MTNNANKSSASPSNAPWRKGRPSFKGYRVEFFFLILLTLVCIVCALIFSVSVCKHRRSQSESSSTSFFTTAPLAFAQDASLDEIAEPATNAPETTQEQSNSENDADATSAPVANSSMKLVKDAVKKVYKGPEPQLWLEITFIWVGFLIVPFILWIWRGWIWFSNIYGTRYELRSEPDNLKATTFLITRGIFRKRTDSMHIGDINDVHSEQSLIQKYLLGGIGNVILHTKDETDPIVNMKNMDDPNRVFNAFDELRRHYWGKGGFALHDNMDGSIGGDGMDGNFNS